MVYYTIYMPGLHNGTGYIDVALADDQLLKDYRHYLDVGVKNQRVYPVASPMSQDASGGIFVIDLARVAAIATNQPQSPTSTSETRAAAAAEAEATSNPA